MLVAGPMARTARDLLFLFDVLTDGRADAEVRVRSAADAAVRLPRGVLDRDGRFRDGHHGDTALEQALARLSAGGLALTRAAPALPLDTLLQSFYLLLTASGGLAVDDAAFDAAQREVAAAGPTLSPLRRVNLEGLTLDHRSWLRLHEERVRAREQIERLLRRETDVLLVPTVNVTAQRHDHSEPPQDRTIQVNGETRPFYSVCDWNSIASYTYLPAVSIPIGLTPDGLPVGVQAIGRRGSDRTLVEFALACEQALGVPPRPTTAAGRDAS